MSSTSTLRRIVCATAVAAAAMPAGAAVAMPAPETQLPAQAKFRVSPPERVTDRPPAEVPSATTFRLSPPERVTGPAQAPSDFRVSSPQRVTVDDDGVNWPSVGLGGGIVGLMMLAAFGAAATVRRHRHGHAA